MSKIILAAGTALLIVLSFVAGYFAGKAKTERDWRLPPATLSDADVSKMKVDGADPVPAPGSKILPKMPLERARIALKELTEKDPVRAVIGSVGRGGDQGGSLTVIVNNTVDCELKKVEGVAYGFDSWGRGVAFNKGGEHFAGFAKDDAKIAAKAPKGSLEFEIKNPGTCSIALAQIDRYTCADGKTWARQ